MGIDIASWRICIGFFLPSILQPLISNNISSAKATKDPSYRHLLLLPSFVLLVLSLTICMDIESNPGPFPTATAGHPITATATPTTSTGHQYTRLFNATERIQLKFTRYKHHLLNYTFYKANNYIPKSLYPSLPPLHTYNQKFYRRWRHISPLAAYRHLKLLITECKNKINILNKELSNHMELLRDSCSPDIFLFYSAKLN